MDFFNDIFHNLALLEFYFLNMIYILLYIDFYIVNIFPKFKHFNPSFDASHQISYLSSCWWRHSDAVRLSRSGSRKKTGVCTFATGGGGDSDTCYQDYVVTWQLRLRLLSIQALICFE